MTRARTVAPVDLLDTDDLHTIAESLEDLAAYRLSQAVQASQSLQHARAQHRGGALAPAVDRLLDEGRAAIEEEAEDLLALAERIRAHLGAHVD